MILAVGQVIMIRPEAAQSESKTILMMFFIPTICIRTDQRLLCRDNQKLLAAGLNWARFTTRPHKRPRMKEWVR
jgi:hypothetical protein